MWLFNLSYLSLSIEIVLRDCLGELMKITYDNFHKLFSAYFHKLFNIAYEDNL